MITWVKRALAAHIVASYLAWTAMAIAGASIQRSAFTDFAAVWIVFGLVAPIGVPIYLAFALRGRISPRPLGIVLWTVYLVVFSLIILAWLHIESKRRRDRQRIRQGLCRWCGYDLRATPGRCPECGKLQIISEIQADQQNRAGPLTSAPGVSGEDRGGGSRSNVS